MAKKRHHSSIGSEMYAGPLQRRGLEKMDGSMISEDHSKMANMPTEVKMMYYPKTRYSTYELDDTIRGIDRQIDRDSRTDERRNALEDGWQ